MKLFVSVIDEAVAMRRALLLLVAALMAAASFAEKLPKGVVKANRAVASVVAYKGGVLKGTGTGVFIGGGDLLSARSLFAGADSAVVIDYKGVARSVHGIVGVNDIFDCARVRLKADKKIVPLALSASPVVAGETLYIVSYGSGKGGFVQPAVVERVDSAFSNAYYTLGIEMEERFLALPVVNVAGELVAVMQPAAGGEEKSYAVGASLVSVLDVTVATYGRGCFPSMGIRTVLPAGKEDALSCLYMLTMLGDSASCGNVVNDFVEAFPKSYEGWLAKAEFEALVCRNIEGANECWKRAFKLVDNPAEVHFGKAKAMNVLVLAGDSALHPMLSAAAAVAEVDRAIAADNQPLYRSGKADMLFAQGNFAAAAECYMSLVATNMRGADLFAKVSQCYGGLGDYARSVEMLDSAVNCFGVDDAKDVAPYVLTRALMKEKQGSYRAAVLDYNRYEELAGGGLGDNFYYLRSQAEYNAKMFQQALSDLDTAISLSPLTITYYIEKALLCYRVKLSDEGIRTMLDALSFAPDAPDVFYLLGRLNVQKGDNAAARGYLERAVELGHPDAASALSQIKE